MKLKKNIILCAALLLGLSSCVSEDMKFGAGARKDLGVLAIDVNAKEPVATRAGSDIDTKDFPVIITDEDGNVVEEYAKVSAVPAKVELPVGKYVVKSHTPGECPVKSYEPYYAGGEPVEVYQGESTRADVLCTMANVRINFNLSEEFKNSFTSWTLSVNSGDNVVVSSSSNGSNREDGLNPDPVYLKLPVGVKVLTIHYTAVTKQGNQVAGYYNVEKKMAVGGYVSDDQENFAGGDDLVLDFKPVASTEGSVTGISVTGHVTFVTTDGLQIVPIVDADTEDPQDPPVNPGGDDDNPPVNPGGDDDADLPSFVCDTWNVSYSVSANNAPETNVTINTPKGLKSLVVKIRGGNSGFGSACNDMGFSSGLELVNNSDFIGGLNQIGMAVDEPKTGDKIYTFPVGAFYGLINMYGRTDDGKAHEFELSVEDEAGNKDSRVLSVAVMP